jgi:hypothetical protein
MNGIVKIHNKEYKTVALRVTEFLASPKHEGWSVETDLISDGTNVVMKSTIKDVDGRVRGTGYAEEVRGSTNINKTSAVENCETSAIGRALSAVGFGGTEYASANEVTDAIIQQTEINAQEQLLAYNAGVRDHIGTISAIKDALATDDLETAAEEWGQLDDEQKRLIWKAPSKGGMFTTKEIATMKTSDFREAGITVLKAI